MVVRARRASEGRSLARRASEEHHQPSLARRAKLPRRAEIESGEADTMHIRKGDTVEVICGDDKGTRGRVLSVDPKKGKLVVEGINRVYKHMRRSQRAAQGGRLSKEMPIDASNVMLIDPTTNQPTRVAI